MKILLPVIAIAISALGVMPVSAAAATAAPKICPDYVQYVCGDKDGVKKTYTNSCFASRDRATHVTMGKCEDQSTSQMKFCEEIYLPVCATKDGQQKTYGNSCFALADGATIVTKGACAIGK